MLFVIREDKIMIKVVAKNKLMNDKIEVVKSLYEELVNATRKEDGCIKYELYQDDKDATVLTMIEEWVDKDALDKHMKTEHFLKIVPMVGEFVIGNELNIYNKVF
ncbi:MAG: antibiotic biosynthesis monooxygenase [Herbinix sp.]|jgi:quinol monooxygenase YgiN|nr:antibiotic biosynthesis monooxygenase [Herbinix sp.]